MTVSVIVPVLNEAENLSDTLSELRASLTSGDEIIVVDGGSTDNSVIVANQHCDRVIQSDRGRACQMNAGAQVAANSCLWFVHADTKVPANGSVLVEQALRDHEWGRFDVRFTSSRVAFLVIAFFMNWRSRLTGIATGDQAIFCRKESFIRNEGFSDLPLMEDIDFSKSMKKISSPVSLSETVLTSSRRWEKYGVLRTVLLMWKLRLLYFVGVPAEKLSNQYRSK